MHCNLRLVDSIEEIGRSDANIDWSSDDEEKWLTDIKAEFELLPTLFFLELFWTLLNVLNFTTTMRQLWEKNERTTALTRPSAPTRPRPVTRKSISTSQFSRLLLIWLQTDPAMYHSSSHVRCSNKSMKSIASRSAVTDEQWQTNWQDKYTQQMQEVQEPYKADDRRPILSADKIGQFSWQTTDFIGQLF